MSFAFFFFCIFVFMCVSIKRLNGEKEGMRRTARSMGRWGCGVREADVLISESASIH